MSSASSEYLFETKKLGKDIKLFAMLSAITEKTFQKNNFPKNRIILPYWLLVLVLIFSKKVFFR